MKIKYGYIKEINPTLIFLFEHKSLC